MPTATARRDGPRTHHPAGPRTHHRAGPARVRPEHTLNSQAATRGTLSARTIAALVVAPLLALTACANGTPATKPEDGPQQDVRLPEAGTVFDYQLGGAYPPADDVEVVSRDRRAKPAPGAYNVCYVNAFQTQPGNAVDWWREHHPRLLLRDDDGAGGGGGGGGGDRGGGNGNGDGDEGEGDLVIDKDWDEPLLDISTHAKRTALVRVVGRWIDGCADDGFDAVEFDNLDSYERSQDLLTPQHAAAFARLLTHRAHARGLAAGQKNTARLLPQRARIGFDFAVVEECARYGECAPFATAYHGRVFDVEYSAQDFTRGCRTWKDRLSVTLRDPDVLPLGEKGHVNRHC